MASDPLAAAIAAAEAEADDGLGLLPNGEPRQRRRRRTREEIDADQAATATLGDPVGDDPSPPPTDRVKPRGRPRSSTGIAALERRLTNQLIEIGMLVSVVDGFDGDTIMRNAERLAKAWCRVAEENKTVRRFLEGGLEGSAWLGAIAATAAVALPILAHHDVLPLPAALRGMAAAAE